MKDTNTKTMNNNTNDTLKPVGFIILNRYLEGCSVGELALEYSVNHALIEVAIIDTLKAIRDKVRLETQYQLEDLGEEE